MRHLFSVSPLFLVFSILVLAACDSSQPVVTMTSLLKEMTDREAIARWPDPEYVSMQASSYNRESVSPDKPGWFADADGLGFIRTEEINGQTEWVLMEDEGPGCVTRIWAPCFYYGLDNTTGANLKFYLDGSEEPVINTNFFQLIKGQKFIKQPFADSTARAGVLIFPVPYAKSCKITMDRKVFYNIISYRKYPPDTEVRSFTMQEFNSTGKLQEKAAKTLMSYPEATGEIIIQHGQIEPHGEMKIDLPEGSRSVRQLSIRIMAGNNYPEILRSLVLSGEFDEVQTIWVPTGDFFSNVGKLRPYRMWERSVSEDGTMVCRWIMPYRSEGVLRLKNYSQFAADAEVRVTMGPWRWDERSMHFHGTWRMDDPYPTFPIFDWNFLEAEGRGVITGDEMAVLNPAEGWWGEGDEKIYVDHDIDRRFPSHFGTGTEDYYGWAGGVVPTPEDEFARPFHGNIIVGDPNSMGYNVCTRTRVLDAIPFHQKIRFDMEASCGTRLSSFFLQYSQTTFWYAIPGVRHNREPLPEMASRSLPTLKGLQEKIENARRNQFIAEGAVEAELYPVTAKSTGVSENLEKFQVWGEVSNGKMKNLWFGKEGDFAEIRITEQFKKSDIRMCATVGMSCGVFDIFVNGSKRFTQDFCTEHSGMTTPLIRLGEIEPADNAFIIRFVYKGKSPKARPDRKMFGLGVDYFLLK